MMLQAQKFQVITLTRLRQSSKTTLLSGVFPYTINSIVQQTE